MDSLSRDFRALLADIHEPPCISIYLPTHRLGPDKQQDSIRFRNLIKGAEALLREKYPEADSTALLAPFRELAEDKMFWGNTLDGLVALGTKEAFNIYRLQETVEEEVAVGDRYLIKPLLRNLQSNRRFQVLAIDRRTAKLYEGDRDALDEVEFEAGAPRTIEAALGGQTSDPFKESGSYSLGSSGSMHYGQGARNDELEVDTERFFRAVDRWVSEHHSRPSRLPLVLAALTEHHSVFHEISKNPLLVEQGVEADPFGVSLDELRRLAWAALEPRRDRIVEDTVERYGTAWSVGLASGDLAELVRAASEGRVDTLLLEAGKRVPGSFDEESRRIKYDDGGTAGAEDLLDELAEMVLRKGGDVLVAPPERMPTSVGAAGIYRF